MKVLIVDDRAENRLILETKMKAADYDVTSAVNGVEALKCLRNDHYDLVVTDLMMPQMDGYQLTHAIKTDPELRDIPILVYTATYTDPKDEALALNLGANGFVLKPASDEEFFSAVEAVIDRSKKGELPQKKASPEELTYLREYSERLIHKLEDKVADHEKAERQLRELNAALELRIRAATAELQQTNQDLEAFAYSVSHDLRGPLRLIAGYLKELQSETLAESERKQFISRALVLAGRGQELIGGLLEYARLKPIDLPLASVPVSRVVQTALEQLDPRDRALAKIEVGPVSAFVLAHEVTLSQVLFNLISNAIKFTRPGETPRIEVTEAQTEAGIRIAVRDRGIGIRAEHRDKLFKPFERLNAVSSYEGTGLGLAIVARAVAKMGGKVGVDSEVGAGSTFWVELSPGPTEAADAATHPMANATVAPE